MVRILDDDVTEEGLAFLVMELLEGELLEARRVNRGGKLPLPEVYEIADQLLDVIAGAHDKGIVHRDIKPDNLFLTHEGRLKVLDFGFAQVKSGFRTERTETGFLLGTPGFMSPEQAVGARQDIDAKTDIWAIGATLFTLLSGRTVHSGETAAELLVAAANYPARSLAEVERGIPPRVVSIVDRALAFDKADRWPSARAMQAALRNVPGRHVRSFASRRSIPDDVEARADDPQEDVLELTSDEIVALTPSWQTNETDRTKVADPSQAIPAAALPSITTENVVAFQERHLHDDEMPTLQGAAPTGALAARDEGPPRGGETDSDTMIMGRVTPQDIVRVPVANAPLHAETYAAARAAPQPAAGGLLRRALVLFGVAAVSMAIVVVTGLLVLAAQD